MAQFGRALRSGRRGRGFESRRLDEQKAGDTARYRKVSPVFLFVNTTESNWQGICAAEGVVAVRPVDARSATTGAENESRRLDCRKPSKIKGFRYFFAHFSDDIWSRVVNDLQHCLFDSAVAKNKMGP